MSDPIKLYCMPGACSLASRIALHRSGLDHEAKPLSHAGAHSVAFPKINP